MLSLLAYWLGICIYLLVAESCNKSNSDNCPNLTVGFLGSFTYEGGIAKLIVGAIPLAVDHVNKDENLLPNHTLQFMVGDILDPNSPTAIEYMTDMREQGVVGFIGPDHKCACEASVASAWKIPMITYTRKWCHLAPKRRPY